MAMNTAGERGYVPQNYLEVEGLDPNASIDQVVAEQQVRSLAQLYSVGLSQSRIVFVVFCCDFVSLSKATYASRLRALQGPCVSLKSPLWVQDRDEAGDGRNEREQYVPQ